MALIRRLQRLVTHEQPGLVATVLGVAAGVVAPTLVRAALEPVLGQTLWFPTYYPAALIGTLFLGWRAGVILMLLSACAANYFFVPPRYESVLNARNLAGTVVFLLADGLIVMAAALLRAALVRLEAANERERTLNQELQHRMKNTLAVVQGLVAQTVRRGADDPREFQRMLEGRLNALGSAHDILATGRWETCDLRDLAAKALEPFRDHGAITISGPAYTVRPECCVPLMLALHELATNAVKHGALSAKDGRASLTWPPVGDRDVLLNIRWAEAGGPPVGAPTRRGLGSRLLTRQAGLEDVALHFNPEGLVCEIIVRRGLGGARKATAEHALAADAPIAAEVPVGSGASA